MGIKKFDELKKFKRFGSRGQFDEWMNSNANLEQKKTASGLHSFICEDYEYRVYWVSENKEAVGGFITIITWTIFVFEKEDIERYAAEVKFASEENHKLLYDQQHYDD